MKDHDQNTSLHLADSRAEYPGKHNCTQYSAVMEDGKRVWKKYETLFVDGEDFIEIGRAFEENFPVNTGLIGEAKIRLMNQRDLVDYAVGWIENNRKLETFHV